MKNTLKKITVMMLTVIMVLAMSNTTFAATKTLKTQVYSNTVTCTSVYTPVTNYGWISTYRGYMDARIKLKTSNPDMVREIISFMNKNKVVPSVKTVSLDVRVRGNDRKKLAWASKNDCGKISTTLKLVDTNNDKKADCLYIVTTAAPKKTSTVQGNLDTYTGTIKIPVKRGDAIVGGNYKASSKQLNFSMQKKSYALNN